MRDLVVEVDADIEVELLLAILQVLDLEVELVAARPVDAQLLQLSQSGFSVLRAGQFGDVELHHPNLSLRGCSEGWHRRGNGLPDHAGA
jgi:hypothetical protein